MNELADYATLVFTQIKKKQTHRRPHTLFLSVPFGSLMWSLFNTYSRNTLKRNRTLFLLLFNVDIYCAHISFIFRTMFEISKIGARRFCCFTSPSQFLSLSLTLSPFSFQFKSWLVIMVCCVSFSNFMKILSHGLSDILIVRACSSPCIRCAWISISDLN